MRGGARGSRYSQPVLSASSRISAGTECAEPIPGRAGSAAAGAAPEPPPLLRAGGRGGGGGGGGGAAAPGPCAPPPRGSAGPAGREPRQRGQPRGRCWHREPPAVPPRRARGCPGIPERERGRALPMVTPRLPQLGTARAVSPFGTPAMRRLWQLGGFCPHVPGARVALAGTCHPPAGTEPCQEQRRGRSPEPVGTQRFGSSSKSTAHRQ